MSTIFFYGLFMDADLLADKGLRPTVVGRAVLPGYRIHIGDRATLLPAESRHAHGVVMELSDREAEALYSEQSVLEYVRETVQVTLVDTPVVIDAWCYNLPAGHGLSGSNPTYAARLSGLVASLGFEPAYVEEIAAFG